MQPEESPPRKVRLALILLGLLVLSMGAYIIVSGPVVVEVTEEVERGTFEVLPPNARFDLTGPILGFGPASNVAVEPIEGGRIVYDLDTMTYIVYSVNTAPNYGRLVTGGSVAVFGTVSASLGFFLKPMPPRSTTMRVMGRDVRIRIDWDSCMGASSCVTLAPKVFRLDPERMKSVFMSRAPLEVLDEKGADPETIFLAAQSCPYKAIILEDAVTGEQLFP